ncbi:SMC family ATPase [Belliella sp. DSM 107340]|uniref:SMC family ATPase n=1 Tax=Belliella calami TaxID=2923436 RepID=A0ABS9UM40_9BACT|nr:SMC family ATPase [Belliella calami]MCH7397617.1 SMC family ATPase [Belliella calami]
MIPIKLEIQGLYSYKEKQTIEFDQLTAAGLFGIFGAVGSGKSSILEAVLLALYGSTERLSDRGEKNSMVNLQSESLLINFEFKAGKNNRSTYIARYSAKRNPKKFDDVKPAEHTFYLKTDSDLEPLTIRGEEILGMKKEHFKQTVIIPQGKFKEFIDLTPGPRAEMMKELFGLERFDLSHKTSSLLKNVMHEKTIQKTHLDILEGYTDELLEEKEKEIKRIADQAGVLEKEFQIADTTFKKQEQIQTLFLSLQKFQREYSDLEAKKPEIEEKKTIYKDFLKAKTYLKPVWDQIEEKNKEIEKHKVSLIDCERFRENYIQEIKQKELEEADLKEKANKKSERESKIRDLEKVKEIQEIQQKIKESEKKIEVIEPTLETKKSAQLALEAKINSLEEELDKNQIPDSNQLAELKSAVKDWETWTKSKKDSNAQIEDLETSVKSLQNVIDSIKEKIPPQESTFDSWMATLKNKIKDLEIERNKLTQKKGLNAHIHLLEDGNPCPLCGSLSHPNPLSDDAEDHYFSQIEFEIEKTKNHLEEVMTLSQKLVESNFKKETFEQQLQSKKSDLQSFENQIKDLEQSLKQQKLDDIQAVRSFLQNTENEIEKRNSQNKQLKSWRKNWQEEKVKLEADDQQYQELKQGLLTLHSLQNSKRNDIKDLGFCQAFFEKDAASILLTIQKVQMDIDKTADLLNGIQKVLVEIRAKQATNLANLENSKKSLKEAENKIQELKALFSQLKNEHGFEDEEKLFELFHHRLDADKVEIEIRNFEQRVHLVETRIEEIQKTEGISDFNQESFEELKNTLDSKTKALDAIKKEFTLLDREIKESVEKLEEKKRIQQTYGKLENRESNLRELEKLFKGSGFVKYVSSIYLKELCNTANIRFNKLTKNSLSLEIDDNNTFWVIDYLNGGKKRLLKTLSGGQTFQASLCLALALAEKVKSLNEADQSFFFLDEGFGALDRNSLRVVFETLKALRHENRVVGIISHVEELQQEIEVYAKIELDAEKGSQVRYSF